MRRTENIDAGAHVRTSVDGRELECEEGVAAVRDASREHVGRRHRWMGCDTTRPLRRFVAVAARRAKPGLVAAAP